MLYTTSKPAAEPDASILFMRTFLALLGAAVFGMIISACL